MSKNITPIAKCCICGKMFKPPLTLEEVRVLEKSEELALVCPSCALLPNGKTKKR